MDYQKLIQNLLSEVKKDNRSNEWNGFFKVLSFIGLLPFHIITAFFVAYYHITLFFYNALLSPISYLEAWQKEKKDEVHFITQAVIYLISTPFIFTLRTMLSLFSFSFYFIWFFLMLFSYITTYCGIRWQPYINTATFDKEYTWKYSPEKSLSVIYPVLLFVLILLTLLVVSSRVITVVVYPISIILIPFIFKKEEIVEEENTESASNDDI